MQHPDRSTNPFVIILPPVIINHFYKKKQDAFLSLCKGTNTEMVIMLPLAKNPCIFMLILYAATIIPVLFY